VGLRVRACARCMARQKRGPHLHACPASHSLFNLPLFLPIGLTVAADAALAGATSTPDIITGSVPLSPVGVAALSTTPTAVGGGFLAPATASLAAATTTVAAPDPAPLAGAFGGGGGFILPTAPLPPASITVVGGLSPTPGQAVGAVLPGRGAAFSSGGGGSVVTTAPDGSTLSMSTASSGGGGGAGFANLGASPAVAAVSSMMGGGWGNNNNNPFGPAFASAFSGRRRRRG